MQIIDKMQLIQNKWNYIDKKYRLEEGAQNYDVPHSTGLAGSSNQLSNALNNNGH